jgi:chloramphenicol O-acetyltransferase
MRVIEQESWLRREHFRLFSGFEMPHLNSGVQVDITELWHKRARSSASPTVTLVYTVTRVANRVPELRQRIRGEQIVEHEVIHPLITVLGDDDLFGVVTLTYDAHFATFASRAADSMAKAKESASLNEFPHDPEGEFPRDDLLSITILPWLAFTGFALTRNRTPVDTIPLLAIGKVQAAGERYLLPFFVNFHHALVDGLHLARFVKYIEEEARELAVSFG